MYRDGFFCFETRRLCWANREPRALNLIYNPTFIFSITAVYSASEK
jgi:hypothetical protein